MTYDLFFTEDGDVAGLMELPKEACDQGAQPGWIGYVGVADVDAACERGRAAGGQVHRPPEDIPGVGRFAVVADPQGAAFCLFTPAAGQSGQAARWDAPGQVGWRELMADRWEDAFAFYAGQFGWTKAEAMDMGSMGVYQLFAIGGQTAGGMMSRAPEWPGPAWLYYFIVPAIDPAIGRIESGGGRVLHGPQEVPGGAWIVQATDPQGALFALVGGRAG